MRGAKFIALSILGVWLAAGQQAAAKTPLKITEIHSEHSPLITFRVILRAGSVNDIKGKEGINALTALLLAHGGTSELRYQDVEARLYPWAANINVQPDKEITTFVANVHRDHVDKFYKIFSDLLINPRFDPEDFKRNKDLAINYLEKTLRGADDENLGKEALNLVMYAEHPYGTAGATVRGLNSITLEDVKEYYNKTYTRGNIWIGIAGGYPKALVERIKKDFGSLPEGQFAPAALPTPEKTDRLEITYIQKPTRATAISMGHPIAITRKDNDFYALMVANSYFGEHRTFNGVLMNRLRGDRGLNYGDYSYIERFVGGTSGSSRFPNVNTPLRQQFFSIWLRPVEPQNAHFAIRAAMFELGKFVENGLTVKQFEETKTFLINYSKLWAQTLDRRLGYKMDSEFYGTDYYIDRIERELKKLTPADVNNAIKKYISPRNLKVAIVAPNAKELMDAMVANTPSPITYPSPVAERILEEDKIISVLQLDINKSRSKVIVVDELFEKESPGLAVGGD